MYKRKEILKKVRKRNNDVTSLCCCTAIHKSWSGDRDNTIGTEHCTCVMWTTVEKLRIIYCDNRITVDCTSRVSLSYSLTHILLLLSFRGRVGRSGKVVHQTDLSEPQELPLCGAQAAVLRVVREARISEGVHVLEQEAEILRALRHEPQGVQGPVLFVDVQVRTRRPFVEELGWSERDL